MVNFVDSTSHTLTWRFRAYCYSLWSSMFTFTPVRRRVGAEVELQMSPESIHHAFLWLALIDG